jgi:hypothetical protein
LDRPFPAFEKTKAKPDGKLRRDRRKGGAALTEGRAGRARRNTGQNNRSRFFTADRQDKKPGAHRTRGREADRLRRTKRSKKETGRTF